MQDESGEMIRFEDIASFRDEEMRPIYERLTASDLAMALKTAPPKITEKFLGNMHEHTKDMMERAMARIEDPSAVEIDAARARVLEVVRDLRSKT